MREIKFRAWHKGYDRANVRIPVPPIMLHESYAGEVFNWLHQNQPLEIMQFTGLTDKNGKEIYEGDILKSEGRKIRVSDNKPVGEIITKIKTIGWQEDWGRFQLIEQGKFSLLPCTKQEWMTEFYEVIGNIYENPELIEVRT